MSAPIRFYLFPIAKGKGLLYYSLRLPLFKHIFTNTIVAEKSIKVKRNFKIATTRKNIDKLPYECYDENDPYSVLIRAVDKTIESCEIHDDTIIIYNNAFEGCEDLFDVSIPGKVKRIRSGAFKGCESIETIVIPDSVVFLGASVFKDCSLLSDVVIGKNVESINGSTFERCDSLRQITISKKITVILGNAFKDCVSLESINIPKSVALIEESAFSGCVKLADVNYEGNEELWEKIKIEEDNDDLVNAQIIYETYEANEGWFEKLTGMFH